MNNQLAKNGKLDSKMDKTKHGLKHIPSHFGLELGHLRREKRRGEEEKERREEEEGRKE